jgi:hypothetical protein
MRSKSDYDGFFGRERVEIERVQREEQLEDKGLGKLMEDALATLKRAMELDKDKLGLLLHHLGQAQEAERLPAPIMEKLAELFPALFTANLSLVKVEPTFLERLTGLGPERDPASEALALTAAQLRLIAEVVNGPTRWGRLSHLLNALVEEALGPTRGRGGQDQERLARVFQLLGTRLIQEQEP